MKNVIDSIDKYNKKKNLETELYKAFNESYSNDKFKRLVDKLRLNIEVLSKYTSELEESSIEYDHCLNDMGFVYNDLIDMNINVTERGVFCIVLQGHLIKRNH